MGLCLTPFFMPREYRIAALIALLLPHLAQAQARPATPTASSKTATAAPSSGRNYASAGQPALPNALSLSVGASHLQARDEALLPVVHRGLGGDVVLGYRRSQAANQHEVILAANIHSPVSRVDAGSQHIALALHYRYLRLVADLGNYDEKHRKPASLWLGARIGGGPGVQSYPQIDEAHAYWSTLYQLGPSALIYWQAKPRLAWLNRLELPLVALAARPPAKRTYFNDDPAFGPTMELAHQGMGAQFAHRAGELQLSSALEYPLHKKVMQRVSYVLRYSYARMDAPWQSLNQGLQWQTSWSF